jgi:hypothetical protein
VGWRGSQKYFLNEILHFRDVYFLLMAGLRCDVMGGVGNNR